jgi:tetratricopeptide (TPR) repeat protein
MATQRGSRDGSQPGPGPPGRLTGLSAHLVDVTVLDDDEAISLLDAALRAAQPSDDRITSGRDAAKRLAGACGRLSLALQIIAALLSADPTLSTDELAAELGLERERLTAPVADNGNRPGASSMAAVLELSYRRLTETEARLFRLLPVNPGPDVATAAVAVLAGLPASEANHVLEDLTRAHLVKADVDVGGRWRMHDLVRLYARELSDIYAEADGREQASDQLLDYYLDMTEAADYHLRSLPGMARPQAFTGRDDALAWLDAERVNLIASVQMAADTGRGHVAASLPLLLARYLAWRRRFEDLLATTTISLNAARCLGDRYRDREGDALTNLGLALQEMRRFEEAITAHEDAAAIFRETRDRHAEGDALNNLGLALKAVRRFSDAITAHQEAAAIFRETRDRHAEGGALNNLGLALKAMRRFSDAIVTGQDAVAIFRETGDLHGEGNALNNLGSALRESGRPEEAIITFQNAVAIFKETGDQYARGVALNNLGSTLADAERFEEAVAAHQEAAAIFCETGDQHRERVALENLEKARLAQLA